MNAPLMAVVVGCNVLKLVGLGLTWIFLDKQPLLTLGGKLETIPTALILALTGFIMSRCCGIVSRVS